MDSTNKKDEKKKEGLSFSVKAVIFGIVIIAIGFGIYYVSEDSYTAKVRTVNVPANYVQYPLVSSKVTAKDGKSHVVDIDFTIDYSDPSDVAAEEDYSKIKEAMSGAEYEKIQSEDGIDYIVDTVKDALGDNAQDVYIGNIVIDSPGLIESTRANE